MGANGKSRDTDYYDSLISKLYKPIVKPIEEPAEEPVFEVTVPKEPEPAVITGERKPDKESAKPQLADTLKRWMNKMLQPDDDE